MSVRTMSGLGGVLAGLAVCGLGRVTVIGRGEVKCPEEIAPKTAG